MLHAILYFYFYDSKIPASVGEFESCMRPGAQTREHAVLLKALVSVLYLAPFQYRTISTGSLTDWHSKEDNHFIRSICLSLLSWVISGNSNNMEYNDYKPYDLIVNWFRYFKVFWMPVF